MLTLWLYSAFQRRRAGQGSSPSSGRRRRFWTGSATRWRRTNTTPVPSTSRDATWTGPPSATVPLRSYGWSLGLWETSSTPSFGTSVSPGQGSHGNPESDQGGWALGRTWSSWLEGTVSEPRRHRRWPEVLSDPPPCLRQPPALLMNSAGSSSCWRKMAWPSRRA